MIRFRLEIASRGDIEASLSLTGESTPAVDVAAATAESSSDEPVVGRLTLVF